MASLQILSGTNDWKEFVLESDRTTLGRNPQCDVVIAEASVSREHACIVRDKDRFCIEDLQSRNGTFVNNQQIAGRTFLNHNDRIRICDFRPHFHDPARLKPLPAEFKADRVVDMEDDI